MTTDTTAYDFSKLLKLTKALQEMCKCSNCQQTYKKKWCKEDGLKCFFCHNFLPFRDNYSSILRDIDWWFLRSGEYDREEFYPDFLNNLKIWAEYFSVLPTKNDLEKIKQLYKVKNWTRNEPEYYCDY